MKLTSRKLSHPDAVTIRNFAFDCTIGCGRVGEDEAGEPGQGELDELARVLGRSLTPEDIKTLVSEWRRCIQSAAQP
jgi:hypothetical protein